MKITIFAYSNYKLHLMHQNKPDICDVLQGRIAEQLTALIDSDYIYLDLPYHSNIGDTLIWLGTDQFLKRLPYRCLGQHSISTFDFRPLPPDAIILLHGGGNFGDLWRKHQDFRLKVISTYVENRIIILPQTIFYASDDFLAKDVKELNQHPQLTICARDNQSAELLRKSGFVGQVLLLPDMAFCISREQLRAQKSVTSKETMLLLRADKEAPRGCAGKDIPQTNIDVKDWPNQRTNRHIAINYLRKYPASEADTLIQTQLYPLLVSEGVKFVSEYKMVYTTRLHVAILRLLLGLPVKIMDNSYGKNLNFYNTWLRESELIDIPNEEEQRTLNQVIWLHQKEQKTRKMIKKACIGTAIITLLILLTCWLQSINL